ncbi:MAG: efflux RND transporter periplasmic adaptor subunit, partial [Planctomycetota bacterium]
LRPTRLHSLRREPMQLPFRLLHAACCCLLTFPAANLLLAQSASDTDPPPPVVVEPVIEASVRSGYRVVGTVSPVRTTTIGSGVPGRILQMRVKEGQRVQEGDPIAILRTETLEIELRAAEAELELYSQELAEFRNGSRPEEIQEAEALAKGAEAVWEGAKSQLRRQQSLAAARASTPADLESAQERAAFAAANHRAAQATLNRLRAGPRAEQIAQKQAQVELQTQKIRLIKDRITKHTIRAPFQGFVSNRFTEVGAWISSGDPIIKLIELDEVEIRLPVTAEYIGNLSLGDSVRVEFSQIENEVLTGILDRVVPNAEAGARTYPVFVRLRNEFSNGVPMLLGGMLARVDLPAGTPQQLPLVPKDALVLSQGQSSVFVVDPDKAEPNEGTVREIPVRLGVASGRRIQIHAPVKQDQLVVVVGNERLQPGQRVSIKRRLEDAVGVAQGNTETPSPDSVSN